MTNIDELINSENFNIFCKILDDEILTIQKNKNLCSDCNSSDLIIDNKNGIIICKQCGQVNENIIDTSNEWKSYDNNNNNARINLTNYNSNRHQYYSNISYKINSFNKESKILNNICEKYKIPKNIEYEAKVLRKIINNYKHVSGKNIGKYKIIRGNNRISINANCIYIACLKNKYSITIINLAKMFNITEKEINKGFKICKSILDSDSSEKSNLSLSYTIPAYFIKNYCVELKINEDGIQLALNIANNINILKIATNFTTISLAASSILLMSNILNINLTKQQIASLFNISNATLTKVYKEIIKYKKILIDDTYINIILNDIQNEIKNEQIPEYIKNKLKLYNI